MKIMEKDNCDIRIDKGRKLVLGQKLKKIYKRAKDLNSPCVQI